MFCSNCGNELKSGEVYCPKCGAKAGSVKKTVDVTQFVDKGLDVRENCRNGLNAIGEKRLVYFASILLQIISIFLVGNEMFKISYEIFYKYSSEYTLFEDNEALRNIFILGYAVAAVAMLLPLLLSKEWKKSYFVPGMFMPSASLAWFIVVIIQAFDKFDSSDYKDLMEAADFSVKLTSNGCIFVLVMIAGLAMTYYASKSLANNGENSENQTQNQTCKAKLVGIIKLASNEMKYNRDVWLTFELEDGRKINLFDKSENQLSLGDEGMLTWCDDIVVLLEK